MMTRLLAGTLTISIALTTAQTAFAVESRFLDGKQEGFFWYKDPKLVEPQEEKPEPEVLAKPPVQAEAPPPVPAEPAGPAPLSAEWIRTNLPKYLDAAIDNPTPENVAAYLYLQKYSMDKATKFSEVSERVTLGTSLDADLSRPSSQFAKDVVDSKARTNQQLLMKKIGDRAGLFVFVENTEESFAQANVLETFIGMYEFSMVPIAVQPLSESFRVLGDVLPDNGHTAQLNIQKYPAIALMDGNGTFDVLSQNMVALSGLEKRVAVSALRLGVITEDEYNKARVVDYSHTLAEAPDNTLFDPNVPVPAAELIQQLQARGQN